MNNQDKIALVTGANKGLGLETARQLARLKIQVIVSARDTRNLRKTRELFKGEGIDADFIQLDTTSADDIQKVKTYIESTYGKLDILINNAGVSIEKSASYAVNTSRTVDMATLQTVYQTNLFGVIMLTQALLPLLEKSTSARIVNLSSELGSLTFQSDPNSAVYNLKKFAYNSSKTALNQFTIHLAGSFKDSTLKVNSVSPGWVKTDMGTPYAPLEVEEGARIIVTAATLPDDGPNGSFFTHDMKAVPW